MTTYRTTALVEADPSVETTTLNRPGVPSNCPMCGTTISRGGELATSSSVLHANVVGVSGHQGPHRRGFLWLKRCRIQTGHLHAWCRTCGGEWTSPMRGEET